MKNLRKALEHQKRYNNFKHYDGQDALRGNSIQLPIDPTDRIKFSSLALQLISDIQDSMCKNQTKTLINDPNIRRALERMVGKKNNR